RRERAAPHRRPREPRRGRGPGHGRRARLAALAGRVARRAAGRSRALRRPGPGGRRRLPRAPLRGELDLALAPAAQAEAGGPGALPAPRRGLRSVGAPAPRVTVFVPVYNRARALRDALQSVLAQRYTDFELLVIDDGSSDDSVEVVRELGDPRI